ncbi:unnamed protein product [Arabidopsis thaliana]|uniref:Kinesin motor domain-containing protein n=1 Tax=Arabidopsis thaliana TaxID=3702 RepID=A0A5S9WXX9_ARATH|nr:unnamed protein product [Arabidopsis thaliana]
MDYSKTPAKTKLLGSSSISNVRVVLRVRPFLPREISDESGDGRSCVSIIAGDEGDISEVAVYLKDPDSW